jgi:hypothetical protein
MEAIPNYTILNLFVISEEVYWSLGKQTTPAMAMGFIQRPLKLSEILVSRGLQSFTL